MDKNSTNITDEIQSMFEIEKITETCIKSELILPQFEGLSEELICSICLDIVWKPICCSKCSSPFGETCLNNWFEYNKLCPKQCIFEKSEVTPLLKRLINKIEFYCLFKHNGCNQIIKYGDFYNHVNLCDYSNYKCLSIGCNIIGTKEQILNHLKICEFGEEICNKCELVLKRKDYFLHKQNLNLCIEQCLGIANKQKQLNSELSQNYNDLANEYHEFKKTKNESELINKNIISTLDNENNILKDINHNLNTKLEEIIITNSKLEIEYNEVKKKTDTLEVGNKEIKAHLKVLEEAYIDAVHKIEDLTKSNFDLQNANNEINEKNNKIELTPEYEKIEEDNINIDLSKLITYTKLKKNNCTHDLVLADAKFSGLIHCNICCQSNLKVSWCCRICNFDACIICYEKEFPNNNVYCENKHLLSAMVFTPDNTECDTCEKCKSIIINGNSFACLECNYYICLDCYNKEKTDGCIIF